MTRSVPDRRRSLTRSSPGGQIRLLPDSRPAPAGDNLGGVAPGVADAGPGDGADTDGDSGGVSQQLLDLQAVSAGAGPGQGGAVPNHIRGSRAAGHRGVSVLCPDSGHLTGGGGRGPLHLPVGAGFSARLFEYPRLRGVLAPAACGGCVYCHRHAGRAAGHSAALAIGQPSGRDHRV